MNKINTLTKLTVLAVCLTFITSMAAFAAVDVDATAHYLTNTVTNPTVASIGGEWTVIGLARSSSNVSDEYFNLYFKNASDYITSKGGILHSRKYTEYSRVVLALTAIGKSPESIAGYSLIEPLTDYNKVVLQGINGPVWALIALDSGGYGDSDIRERYIAHILERKKSDGGWALSDSAQFSDTDITAMVLTALSKYKSRSDVSSAIDSGLTFLSNAQNDNGGYTAYGVEASESAAQVLTALSALKIPCTDERFVKNGNTLKDNILSFKNADGSFSHTDTSNLMATEQCFYALVAAERFESGKSALFDMNNSDSDNSTLPAPPRHNPYRNIFKPSCISFAELAKARIH